MANDAPTEPSSNGQGEVIRVRGARVHNLKNIDLDIPRDQLVVITGLSGSGKSSLAFDTLYAEGQRQYIESLSVYARQFFDQLERPDVDLIEGLQPTISIDQRSSGRNPRSTVATVTEINDYLRLLFARVGDVHCFECGERICHQTTEQILEDLAQLPEKTKLMLLAPQVRGRKGQHKDVFAAIRKARFVRARVNGTVYDIDSVPELVRQRKHTIEAVVDRIVIREGIRPRLAESLRLAIQHGEGVAEASYQSPGAARDEWQHQVFSTNYACPACRTSYSELEPRTFSFNSPYGACGACEGLGAREQFDPELVVPDPSRSLASGAIAAWRGGTAAAQRKTRRQIDECAAAARVDPEMPFAELSPEQVERFFRGVPGKSLGVLTQLEKEYSTATKRDRREHLELFRGAVECADCEGTRLRPEARSVLVADRSISDVAAMNVEQAVRFFAEVRYSDDRKIVSKPLVVEIQARLEFLMKVGLGYLTLNRPTDTLSGGEVQRVRLSRGLGSGLVGVCYILDEPSIGLHPRDNHRLIEALKDLKKQGNSVIVVEHDESMMRSSDYLIDMGPGAGCHGGRLVAQGDPETVARDPGSVTGRFLIGAETLPTPAKRRRLSVKRSLTIEGVRTHNLREVNARIPLNALVCMTGVSGSGKSSLLIETLYPALARRIQGEGRKPGPYTGLRGASLVDRLVLVDQLPIGRTPRSNPATYTGVWDEIRRVFAGTREAKIRGYRIGRFSFNVKGGRCEACQGQGLKKIEMNFLPDLYVQCEKCHGTRFNRQTRQVHYRGRSIADVLEMTVEEALEFFENFPAIARVLQSVEAVGLGYLMLGQPSTTLSGGEAQRIKLATELSRTNTGNTLYVLDEPTTGLHFADVRRLLDVLNGLVDLGNTVVVIEHHLDVIKTADWIVDLGPEGGEHGGRIVAEGTPEDLVAAGEGHTAEHLARVLQSPAKA